MTIELVRNRLVSRFVSACTPEYDGKKVSEVPELSEKLNDVTEFERLCEIAGYKYNESTFKFEELRNKQE